MKARNLRTITITALVAASSVRLAATEFVVTNVTDATVNHRTAAIYAGGVAPNPLASTGLTEDIVMTNKTSFVQTLATGNYNPPTSNEIYFGDFLGDEQKQFCYNLGYANRTLHLIDTARWPGLFYVDKDCGNMGLKYETPDNGRATLPNAGFFAYLNVGIGGKDTRLDINKSQGRGFLAFNVSADATKPGTIALNDPVHGIRSRVIMNRGDLEIAGAPYDVPGVAGKPYLHLDATVADSLVKTEDATLGRTFVERWNDRRGGADRPYAVVNDAELKPFLATDAECGKPVVDFGVSLYDSVNECGAFLDGESVDYHGYSGPSLLGRVGYLRLNEKVTNVREVFVVLRESRNHTCFAPFLYNEDGGTQSFPRYCERDNPLFTLEQRLFKTTTELKDADVRLNGAVVAPELETSLWGHLNVVSVGLSHDGAGYWIGSNGKLIYKHPYAEKNRGYGYGGFTLGEMLIYTNALTSAQRREVNAYLKAKWRLGEEALDTDFAGITLPANRAVVVSNGTARTRALDLTTDKTLTKRGAGTLDVSLAPTNRFALAVEGGKVRFSSTPPMVSENPQPAPAPFAWLKAEDAKSFTVTSESEGVQTFTAWRHAENGGTNMEGIAVTGFARKRDTNPTRYADATLGGKYVIDLGPYNTTDSSCVEIKRYRTNNSSWYGNDIRYREGFLVFRSAEQHAQILASSDTTIFRDNYNSGSLLSGFGNRWYGDYFALDGVRLQPFSVRVPDNEWHVLSYRFMREAPSVGSMGAERGGTPTGALRYAEVIHYDRELTEKEFRDTEAYLLKKYFGKDHPDAVRAETPMTVSKLSFASGATPEVDTDRDMALNEVSGDITSFAKSGTGTVTVATMPVTVKTVAAQGGTLAMTADWLGDAAFHVDASVADSFDFVSGQEADGRIDKWYDCRGKGGMYARCLGPWTSATYASLTNATYETSTGEDTNLPAGKHYVDFGSWADDPTSAMWWYDATGTQVKFTDLREMHFVYSVTSQGNHTPVNGADIVPNGYLDTMYHSSWKAGQCATVRTDGGAWRTNNKYQDSSKSLNVSNLYVTTVSFSQGLRAHAFAVDRDSNAQCGRIKLCEVILFCGATNTTERAEAIHDYLRKKWLDIGSAGPQPVAFDSLSASAGATLSVDSGVSVLSTKALTGAGTVVAPGGLVVNGANPTFDATFTDAATCGKLTVEGALALPAAGRVVVTTPADLRVTRGFYPFLSAESLDVDLSGWTVDAAGAAPKRSYKIEKVGNDLGVRVTGIGTAVFVR